MSCHGDESVWKLHPPSICSHVTILLYRHPSRHARLIALSGILFGKMWFRDIILAGWHPARERNLGDGWGNLLPNNFNLMWCSVLLDDTLLRLTLAISRFKGVIAERRSKLKLVVHIRGNGETATNCLRSIDSSMMDATLLCLAKWQLFLHNFILSKLDVSASTCS